jgi:hypothetical protein
MSARIRVQELSASRLIAAASRRLFDLPHALAWQFSPAAAVNRGRLSALRNKHRGQRCVILANGPSLGRMDLVGLKRETTIGMNRIYLNFAKMGFETSYHIAINELVLEQFGSEISRLRMPIFVNWNRRGIVDKDGVGVHYLRMKLGFLDSFEGDVTKPLSSGGTVTFAALQLAYFLGFKQVVLVGLDHRFAATGTPNKVEQRTESKDADHFHPNYFPAGSRWQLPDLHRSELAYSLARAAYEADGREILDATVDGSCPVFRKAEFSALFG